MTVVSDKKRVCLYARTRGIKFNAILMQHERTATYNYEQLTDIKSYMVNLVTEDYETVALPLSYGG